MRLDEIDITPYDTLLLDRDGVINRLRVNDYVKSPSELELLPEFMDIIGPWSRHFKNIFVITNQRGVGRGLMTENDLAEIHNLMCSEIKKCGGRIDKIYYCTATDPADPRRKPQRGMFDEILADYPGITPDRCIMIGDSDSDMEFARNCGIDAIKYE